MPSIAYIVVLLSVRSNSLFPAAMCVAEEFRFRLVEFDMFYCSVGLQNVPLLLSCLNGASMEPPGPAFPAPED